MHNCNWKIDICSRWRTYEIKQHYLMHMDTNVVAKVAALFDSTDLQHVQKECGASHQNPHVS